MSIRLKLFGLLLLIALVPLAVSATVHHLALNRFGRHLADETRLLLTEEAHSHLHQIVSSYERLQDLNRSLVEAALAVDADRAQSPLSISAANGLSRAFRFLERIRPKLVLRQYTYLESGDGFTYPSHQSFTGLGPLQRPFWYQKTRTASSLSYTPCPDPVTGQPVIMVAAPLFAPEGRFIGVTAVARPVSGLFEDLQMPQRWLGRAARLLVVPETRDGTTRLRILADQVSPKPESFSLSLSDRGFLAPDNPEQKAALLTEIKAGRSGSMKLNFQGQLTHWVFGTGRPGEPIPLLIVAHETITGRADSAGAHFLRRTLQELKLTGVLIAGAFVLVVITASASSRRVTRPVAQLASAARKLADGNFKAKVQIDTGDELEELGRIFNTVGPALQEREYMACSLDLARQIQQQLLPQDQPCLNGFDIHGGGVYSDETGGDYYDFLPLDDKNEQLGLVVGDVSGHGVGAALLMASARGVLRSQAGHDESDLAKLFEVLNRHLESDTDSERYMTLFFGILDTTASSLTWCSAGHGPIFHFCQRRQSFTELPSTGIPLGIFEDAVYMVEKPLFLEQGDLLLAGTDGIWETRSSSGEAFGFERFREVIRKHRCEKAAKIHAAVLESLTAFRGEAPQEDDVTLIVVKMQAESQHPVRKVSEDIEYSASSEG